jgi:hypothetical protein
MAKLWQLKKISTGEPLNEPQLLPENWGPIFGMRGYLDKLNDLSWLGIEDQGWFEVGDAPEPEPEPEPEIVPASPAVSLSPAEQVIKLRLDLLRESDYLMLPDAPITYGEQQLWLEYRAGLRKMSEQEAWPDEPEKLVWPSRPDA